MNELITVIQQSGVEESTALNLQKSFLPFFEQAENWRTKANELVVTDVTQVREMRMAREARLALKEIRVNADKTRKTLKEDSIRYGKAVQGVYNVIEYLIAPIEEHLLQQEKFAEIQEEKRKEALRSERAELLQPYIEFVPYVVDLGNISEEAWDKLLNGAKLQMAAKIEAERKAEEEKIEAARKEAEEREKIRLENERLKAEAIEREKQAEAERKAAEIERRKIEEKARIEREKAEAERKEAERLAAIELEKERKEKARIEAELRAKEQTEKAERERLAKIEADRIAQEKKAAKAPDKIKLQKWVESISAPEITVTTPEAETVKANIIDKIEKFKVWAISEISKL